MNRFAFYLASKSRKTNDTSEPLALMTADRYLSVIKTAIERDLTYSDPTLKSLLTKENMKNVSVSYVM
jgi:hypothetical protein